MIPISRLPRARLCLLMMLAWLGGGVGAQDSLPPRSWQVVLPTRPPGAAVHQNGRFLGVTGETTPILVKFAENERQLNLSLKLAGYEAYTLPLDRAHAEEGRLEPPVDLRPASLWIGLRDWPYLKLALAALALGGLVAAGWGWLTWKVRRQAHLDQREARAIKELQARDPQDTLLGTCLGGYRILRKLGSGGMGQVYLAAHVDRPEEQVALKLLVEETPPEDLEPDKLTQLRQLQEQRRLRQTREIQILNSLRHPNIAALMDYGRSEAFDYLVLELVPGTTLRHRLTPEGLSPSQAWGYLEPLLQGMASAHDNGVVHRDLKPENVMVTPEGRVKVLDFGLGRERNHATVTRSHQVMGTPEYMAPEQVQSQPADPRMDQYAIGVMAYEMLAGRRPFEEAGDIQLMMARLLGDPPPLSQHARVSPELERAVMRMLARDPEQRFIDLREAAKALEEALQR